MFLPDNWPSYFSRSKGCHVWDLDGDEYVDMSIMGIGTNILGYGHDEIDNAISGVLVRAICPLNCLKKSIWLRDLLVFTPGRTWFDSLVAEKLMLFLFGSRAATGRETVAICGYHGWHDWYLATNLQNESA